jgi:hypothetical protein
LGETPPRSDISFDCFLAAGQVGASGRVIGIDMTHEMLKKARENAAKISAANVADARGEHQRGGAALRAASKPGFRLTQGSAGGRCRGAGGRGGGP